MKVVKSGLVLVGAWFQASQSFLVKNRVARLALLLFLSIGSYLFTARFVLVSVQVVGISMMPTLQDGDKRILNRWPLCYRHPRPGDLVVIKDPEQHDFAVKRVIGGPRDIVLVKDGAVYVNGKKLAEPYLSPNSHTYCRGSANKVFPLGRSEYFVLGDNRENSEDSRSYGAIPRSEIMGLIGL
jgi:signal peptidase I